MTLSAPKPSSFSVKDILDLPDAKTSLVHRAVDPAASAAAATAATVVLPLPPGNPLFNYRPLIALLGGSIDRPHRRESG